MGRVKEAFFSGTFRTAPKFSKEPRLTNPFPKPAFWKRGSWKDTQVNRKGVIRKAYFYGRWLGWREGSRGAKARTRARELGGTLDNAVNTKFNAGYLEGYTKGRQERKASQPKGKGRSAQLRRTRATVKTGAMRDKSDEYVARAVVGSEHVARHGKGSAKQIAQANLAPLYEEKHRRHPRSMGPNGQKWPKKPIMPGVTAADVAKYKYGSSSPSNVAAVKRNMGHLLRPTPNHVKRAALYDARKARGADRSPSIASQVGKRKAVSKPPLFKRRRGSKHAAGGRT